MIKSILNESFVLNEIINSVLFQVKLEIDYETRTWTISGHGNSFVFKNTRNYLAGIAMCNLIKEATQIAKNRLQLTEEEIENEELPF